MKKLNSKKTAQVRIASEGPASRSRRRPRRGRVRAQGGAAGASDAIRRCAWANTHEEFIPYHDKEWGVPVKRDDRLLFEMLNLEGAQAGLSWLIILRKRQGYKDSFANFDAKKVAKFTPAQQKKLVKFEGIVRHPGKISAVVDNAKAMLAVQKEFGTFAKYIWSFTRGKVLKGNGKPGPECKALAKDLKKRGFRFVGETTMYAFMQAVGMVNDHSKECFRA